MDRVRVVVWSVVTLLVVAVMATLNRQPEPTFNSILDEHQDCGSGGPDFDALERCLVDRYDWPQLVAERFSVAMRDREESWAALDRPTDWEAFQRYAEDLRATHRALGLRDLADVETEIYADSSVRAFTDSIDTIIRDSVDQARRIDVLVGRGT